MSAGRPSTCSTVVEVGPGCWLRLAAVEISEQPVGDILGKTLGKHAHSDLVRHHLYPRHIFADGLTDQANPVALGEGLRTGEHIGMFSVPGVHQHQCTHCGDITIVNW